MENENKARSYIPAAVAGAITSVGILCALYGGNQLYNNYCQSQNQIESRLNALESKINSSPKALSESDRKKLDDVVDRSKSLLEDVKKHRQENK